MAARLFDEQFLKKLEYLFLLSKKMFAGKIHAATRSKKLGWGMEFADHRSYNPGDDLRYLDWNLYGRVGVFFTKLFHEEENLEIHLILDNSRSMDYGDPTKLDYAKRGGRRAGLRGGWRTWTRSTSIRSPASWARGLDRSAARGQILKVFDFLESLPPSLAGHRHQQMPARLRVQDQGARGWRSSSRTSTTRKATRTG